MIRIREISKSFGSGPAILANLSFECKQGEITSLVGPTGSGKTTILNLISRFYEPDAGEIVVEKEDGLSVGHMMQEPLLLPWRTLTENSLLGAEVLGIRKSELTPRLEHYFQVFDLLTDRLKYPADSSAGMKQRVALIRTLLISPSILLLDEPFSNLDFDIKLKIQRRLLDYHFRNQTTTLLVTHDIEDAIALSDKVVVLSEKPTRVKAQISIQLGITQRDPVEARKSSKFREYFVQIWDELKYLNDD